MIHQYNIKGTPEVYTIAVNSCSQVGDLEFALCVYGDMKRNGVVPDEVFHSALFFLFLFFFLNGRYFISHYNLDT